VSAPGAAGEARAAAPMRQARTTPGTSVDRGGERGATRPGPRAHRGGNAPGWLLLERAPSSSRRQQPPQRVTSGVRTKQPTGRPGPTRPPPPPTWTRGQPTESTRALADLIHRRVAVGTGLDERARAPGGSPPCAALSASPDHPVSSSAAARPCSTATTGPRSGPGSTVCTGLLPGLEWDGASQG